MLNGEYEIIDQPECGSDFTLLSSSPFPGMGIAKEKVMHAAKKKRTNRRNNIFFEGERVLVVVARELSETSSMKT